MTEEKKLPKLMEIINRYKPVEYEFNPEPGLKRDMQEAYFELLTNWCEKPRRLCKSDWELFKAIIDAIFEEYPDACIYQTWTEGMGYGLLVGFRAMGGDGSDDVHILPNGEWSQWMSGDLNMVQLDRLEKRIKRMLKKREVKK